MHLNATWKSGQNTSIKTIDLELESAYWLADKWLSDTLPHTAPPTG
ncbi:MAG: hypothetical protein AAF921_11255 [Cyanobacteria bacterium P01_D01_bin.44]